MQTRVLRVTMISCALAALACSDSGADGGQAGAAGAAGQAGAAGAAGQAGSAGAAGQAGSAGAAGQAGACAQPLVGDQGWPCNQVQPCPNASFDGQALPYDADSASAARCILEKLRDRVVGSYHFSSDIEGFPPGQWVIGNSVNVLQDQTAVDARAEFHDISGQYSSVHVSIKPTAFFDDCLAKSDADLYACLTSWHGETAAQCPVCPTP